MASTITVTTDFPELQTLSFEVAETGIGVLRINRPERMNSQTVRMFTEYGLAAHGLRDSRLRALIVTGAGERAFCSGFDLDQLDVITRMGVREFLEFLETATGGIQAIRHLPFPVIAAVHGAAIGGGLALALAADIRLVSPTAKFSAAFLKVGLSMGELGTSYNLSRLIGPGRAAEIGYTARLVGAAEAVAIGLANRVVPTDRLYEEAVALARLIAANSPGGVRMSKRAIQRNQEITSYAAALELENRGQALLTQSADMPEALAAFKDKRAARLYREVSVSRCAGTGRRKRGRSWPCSSRRAGSRGETS
jgi:enoyl-CoA hydratase/carnithine racemase